MNPNRLFHTGPSCVLFVAVLFLSAGGLCAQDVVTELPRALERSHQKARAKAAKACETFAKWCAKRGANEEARRNLSVAALLEGRYPGEKDIGKLAGQPDDLHEKYAEERGEELEKLNRSTADLFEVVQDAYKEGCEHLVAEASTIWVLFLRDDNLLEKEGWQWNAEAACLLPADDASRIDGGELRFQGRWLSKEEVAKHDEAHSSFASATMLSDGSFTLHSEMPLALSLKVMNHITRWHLHLVLLMSGEMKLRRPDGVLDVYLAKTRDTYNAKAKEITDKQGMPWRGSNFVGTYLGVSGLKLCPLIVSMETPSEPPLNNSMTSLLETVQHEMTHQLLTEGLMYKEAASRRPNVPRFNLWVREGFATWMEGFRWNDKTMQFEIVVVRKTSLEAGSGKAMEGRLYRATQMLDRLKKIEDFVQQSDDEFREDELDAYAQSCALTMFLFGHSAETRARLFELSHSAHLREAGKDAFKAVFKDEDLPALNEAFREWIKNIEFDG